MITALSITGLIFVFLEVILPGAFMGAVGSIILFTDLYVIYNKSDSPLPFFIGLCAIVIASITTIWIGLRFVKRKKMQSFTDQAGYSACSYPKDLIGKEAIVSADLKPSGYIQFGGKQWPALSEIHYIEKNERVLIIGGQGHHLIVTKKE